MAGGESATLTCGASASVWGHQAGLGASTPVGRRRPGGRLLHDVRRGPLQPDAPPGDARAHRPRARARPRLARPVRHRLRRHNGGVGAWSVMASGSWNGGPGRPAGPRAAAPRPVPQVVPGLAEPMQAVGHAGPDAAPGPQTFPDAGPPARQPRRRRLGLLGTVAAPAVLPGREPPAHRLRPRPGRAAASPGPRVDERPRGRCRSRTRTTSVACCS